MNAVRNNDSSSEAVVEFFSVTYPLMGNESEVYNITGLSREYHYTLIITVHNGSFIADSTSRDISE